MFPREFLDELRRRISMAQLVGQRVQLKKAGRNWKGLCPFHQEKSPSFLVSEDKQIFHCFGCAEGGDAIQFTMKFEGVSFREAVEILAKQSGLDLPKTSQDREELSANELHRKRCLRVNQLATEFFQQSLKRPQNHCQQYVEKRGLKTEICTQHFLGFADKDWESLSSFLKKQNVPLNLAQELGLIKKREDGSFYDFFRNRLIFPIFSPQGEITGFGGRSLDDAEQPKYLNSSDSAVYHKSHSVYGLYQARPKIRQLDQVVIVEGYMDVLALAQAGISNAVAPLGTALTEGHVELLRRYTRNIVLIFDGDEAGLNAQMRALPIFLSCEVSPKAVRLPSGEDPDTLVQKEGVEKFTARIKNAPSLFEFCVDRLLERVGTGSAGQVEVLKKVGEWLKEVEDAAELTVYRQFVAKRLMIDEARLPKLGQSASGQMQLASDKRNQVITLRTAKDERRVLLASLMQPKLLQDLLLQVNEASWSDEWSKQLWLTLKQSAEKHSSSTSVLQLLESLEDQVLAVSLREKLMLLESEGMDEYAQLVQDGIQWLQKRKVEEAIKSLNQAIQQAERDGNEEQLFLLLAEKKKLSQDIHSK